MGVQVNGDSKWINVLERAPKMEDANSEGYVLVCRAVVEGDSRQILTVAAWQYVANATNATDVTHWQPISDPPESLPKRVQRAIHSATGPVSRLYLGSKQYWELPMMSEAQLKDMAPKGEIVNRNYFMGLAIYRVDDEDFLAVGN